VNITFPNDGQVFPVFADFALTTEASDDVGVASVELYTDGVFNSADSSEPYAWNIENIPEGEYSFYVVAVDAAGNETMSNTVSIVVTDSQEPTTGNGSGADSGDGGTQDGGTDSGAGDGSGDGSGSLPPGFGADSGDPSGCACAATTDNRPPWVSFTALLFVGPWLRRRR